MTLDSGTRGWPTHRCPVQRHGRAATPHREGVHHFVAHLYEVRCIKACGLCRRRAESGCAPMAGWCLQANAPRRPRHYPLGLGSGNGRAGGRGRGRRSGLRCSSTSMCRQATCEGRLQRERGFDFAASQSHHLTPLSNVFGPDAVIESSAEKAAYGAVRSRTKKPVVVAPANST